MKELISSHLDFVVSRNALLLMVRLEGTTRELIACTTGRKKFWEGLTTNMYSPYTNFGFELSDEELRFDFL